MHPINAIMVTRMLTRNSGLGSEVGSIPFGSVWWFIYAGLSCFFVLFAGIMSGLTLGLMSLGLVDLEILQRSGSPTEKKQAGSFPFRFNFGFVSLVNSRLIGVIDKFVCFCAQLLYCRWFRSSISCSLLCFCVMRLLWK